MSNRLSKRHHYIPEFQLRRFTNEDGLLHVFNKQTWAFHTSGPRFPRQVFFEWNRNLFEVHGKKDDYIEGLYSRIDNDLARSYNRVINDLGNTKTHIYDLFEIILLTGLTYWRMPRTDTEIKKFIDYSKIEDLYMNIYDENRLIPYSHESYQLMVELDHFSQAFRMIKPIVDYLKADVARIFKDWFISSSTSDVQLHLIGDNPIILKTDEGDNIFETELIFPLTKGKTLYYNKGKKILELAPEHTVLVDVLLFIQCETYVAGPNKNYIASIAKIAQEHNTETKVNQLKEEVFNIFCKAES